jgi:cytochrome c oxidase subunit 2
MTPAIQVAQSALDAAGPQAAHIERLWWVMFWVTAAVFAATVLAAGIAAARARSTPDAVMAPAVVAAVVCSAVILLALLTTSVWTGRAVASLGASSAVSIDVTGHRWWWEVEYEDSTPARRVTTANEIHIPVGRPVVLKVTSRDVIHSFWAPNLHGKRDLIPGYTTAIWIQADRPGVYRGQCAEFCGVQHAHMAFTITAEPSDRFERWLSDQRRDAPEPRSADAQRGRQVFLSTTCVMCHTIRGTTAGATLGPDLTHVGSRGTLAALRALTVYLGDLK